MPRSRETIGAMTTAIHDVAARRILARAGALVAALALASCTSDPNLAPGSGAPSYGPAGATPPQLSAASERLAIPTWQWVRTDGPGERAVNATAPDRYTLKFDGGGRVLVRADCNRGSGAYEVNAGTMKLMPIALTRMGCPAGSQDAEFMQGLARVTGYRMDGNELVLAQADGGAMRFRGSP